MLNFCPYCGTKIVRQDVRFCMNCGKSLAEFMGAPVDEKLPNAARPKVNTRKPPKVQAAKSPEVKAEKTPTIDAEKLPNVGAKKSSASKPSASMENELVKCREAAEEGYKLAGENYDEIKNTLLEESRRLNDANAAQVQFTRIKSSELVDKQKNDLRHLTENVTKIHDTLNSLRGRMKDFSIVVYGRTMAGKSTLMEILTHGNGESIGKGSQRTTLDVRDYYWQGLKITDVPGISAFGGEADEKLALEAAKSADLILFLLSDDAPQADEAEKLAQLKNLGKPILGVINVKMSFNMSRRALALRNLQRKLADTDKINEILNQFKNYDKNYDQDWSGIKFVSTHLLAAYQAHPCRNNDAEIFAASQFTEVEDFILDKVRNDGRFLRIKNFADSVAVPMSNIILKIYEHSGTALLESRIWLDKRMELLEWRKDFLARAEKKFKRLYDELSEVLNTEIYNFASYHYEDEHINESWPRHVKSLGLDTRYQNLLKSLAEECECKRKELSDELSQEITYAFRDKTNTKIELEDTTAWGEYGAALIGGLGGVGGFIAARAIGFAFPPLGIALAAVSIIGWIFSDSKETKIRKAKEKLRADLKPPTFEMLGKMHDQVIDIFNKEILNKAVDNFADLLGDYAHMLARLGKSQSDIAAKLFGDFSDLNYKLLGEAIDYTNAGSANVNNIVRIPGESMIILADRSNLKTQKLSDLLGEKISVMKPDEKFSDTLQKILGCDFEFDNYSLDYDTEKTKAERAGAVLPKSKVNATNFKLAQQIARTPIITGIFNRENTSKTNSSSQPKSSSGVEIFYPPDQSKKSSSGNNSRW